MSAVDEARRQAILPRLPARVIDLHTHAWSRAKAPRPGRGPSWPALVAATDTADELADRLEMILPGKAVTPVIFSSPTLEHDTDALNDEIIRWSVERDWPALALTRPEWSAEKLEALLDAGFRGFKPYPGFAPAAVADEDLRIRDFLPDGHLAVAETRGAVVMLHLGRAGRLKDPVDLADLLQIDRRFPRARVVVAHVGRAYVPADATGAWERLAGTENLLFDISANTCAAVMAGLLKTVGPDRVLYGSDLPITAMRMRRIEEGGTYLNLVPRGLYGDLDGVPHMRAVDGPEAGALSLFLYEEIDALLAAVDELGLDAAAVDAIFHDNAARLLGLPLLDHGTEDPP